MSVVVFHVWLYREQRPHGRRSELLDQLLFQTNSGLICFFVLSGFLLYGGFARAALSGGGSHVAAGAYLRRRAVRIVPAYWVCCAGCLVLYAAVGYRDITPSAGELPLHLLFVQNYSLATAGELNPVSWTLGVEVAFYLLLVVIGWVALRLGPRRMGAQVGLVLALVLVSPAWDVLVHTRGWDSVAERALPAYLGSFGLGMLAALWVQWRRAGSPSRAGTGPGAWATAGLVVAAGLVLTGDAMVRENGWWLRDGVFAHGWLRPSIQSALLGHLGVATGFALLIVAAARGRGPAVAWLSWRPLAAVGVVSYGLYLWHLPLLLVLRQAGVLPDAIVPRLLVVATVSLAAAAASWRWVERPWLERGRGQRRAREGAPRPVGSPAESVS